MNNYQLQLALQIAYAAHEGQVDKAGASYILHCVRVADAMTTSDEKIVALLHDIVEDTEITFEYLERAGFSEEVVNAVKAITRELEESYNDYMRRVVKNELAYKVKLADMMDNSDVTRFKTGATKEQIKRCDGYLMKHGKLVSMRKTLTC